MSNNRPIKETYLGSIDEICKVFDIIINHKIKTSKEVKVFNTIRIIPLILKIYGLSYNDILSLKRTDIDNCVIKLPNQSLEFDRRFSKYFEKSFEILKHHGIDEVCCNSMYRPYNKEADIMDLIDNFRIYCNRLIKKANIGDYKSVIIPHLRDSIIFEEIYIYNLNNSCNNVLELLLPIFVKLYKGSCSKYALQLKIQTKYELYLQWVKIFYQDKYTKENSNTQYVKPVAKTPYLVLKGNYCAGINDICMAFDIILNKKSQVVKSIKWYNWIRISLFILRIYNIPYEEIVDFKTLDIENNIIKTKTRTIEIDVKFCKYFEQAKQYLTDNCVSFFCCNARMRKLNEVQEIKKLLNDFVGYFGKTIVSVETECPIHKLNPYHLYDSIVFEKIYHYDVLNNCKHSYLALRELFNESYQSSKISESGLQVKTASKYELYLQWIDIFYNNTN